METNRAESAAARVRDRDPEFDSLRVVSGFDGEILVVESERDEVVPHLAIVAYLDAARNAAQR